jgi:hypothetical protein
MKFTKLALLILPGLFSYVTIYSQFTLNNDRATLIKLQPGVANHYTLLSPSDFEPGTIGSKICLYQRKPAQIFDEYNDPPVNSISLYGYSELNKQGNILNGFAKSNLEIFPQDQSSGYKQFRIRQPDKGTIIGGAILAAIGGSVLFSRPVPDFSYDAKDGPQILFVGAISFFTAGVVATTVGLLHKTNVSVPAALPDPDPDKMKLINNDENNRLKASVRDQIIMGKIKIIDEARRVKGFPSDVRIYDDRFEIIINNNKSVLYLEDIYVNGVTDYDYGNKIAVNKIVFTSKHSVQRLKEDLNSIRAQLIRETEDRKIEGLIESFKPAAARYRSLVDKPVMTEAQRRKVIESETFSSEGKYKDAIKSLLSALEIDPVSYPQGYYNLAFLYERVGNFAGSILNMRKYILLDPFAEDARASQDKIYEWELKRKK